MNQDNSLPFEFESQEMFKASNEAAMTLVKLTAYFEVKYRLTKPQAAYLRAAYLESIPTQIETNPNVEAGLLKIVNEMRKE